MATLCDYFALKDAPFTLGPFDSQVNTKHLDFSPQHGMVLSGDRLHKPILSFRATALSIDARLKVQIIHSGGEIHNIVDALLFASHGPTTINEILQFDDLTIGKMSLKFESLKQENESAVSQIKVSDVILWFKRNVDTT